MIEPAIRKYGEVAAFVRLAEVILRQAGHPLQGHAPEVSVILETIASTILTPVPSEHSELFIAKRDKTIRKLTEMMDLYVGDEWDNPTEVLEWTSFFAGAGAAHCAIAGHLYELSDDTPPTDEQSLSDATSDLEPMFRFLLDATIERLGH